MGTNTLNLDNVLNMIFDQRPMTPPLNPKVIFC